MSKRETTDGRYVEVAKGEWWDTTGIDILPESVVEAYLEQNPDVGIVVLEGEIPEGDGPPVYH
jgi:hypothetical protein